MRARVDGGSRAEAAPSRRVLALVLPALLVELAEPRRPAVPAAARGDKRPTKPRLPVAVVLDETEERRPGESGAAAVEATSVLSAVNDVAQRLGIREGQTVAEARAFSSRLVVRSVARSVLEAGLARVADITLAFGTPVAFAAPDTVWVDVTGTAHLFGGEAALASELVGRIREAGHRVRAAISDGPLLAQAFARFGEPDDEGVCVVPSESTRQRLAHLPLRALSLPSELEAWFIRLGVLTIADLVALPRGALGARLAEHTSRVLELTAGRDTTPLVRYEPARTLIEESSWEEPVDGREPLLFVLRGLVGRISARLRGRGEAAQSLVVRIVADAGIARLRGVARETTLEFALPKPLHREEELRRIVSSRFEHLTLAAPSVGLRLEVPKLTEAMPRQLELGALLMGAKSDAADELPIVLAELGADIGHDRLGVLKTFDSHRPELTSRLVPALRPGGEAPRVKKARPPRAVSTVTPTAVAPISGRLTRALPEAVPFDAPLRAGSSVMIDHRLYAIESVQFEYRLQAVEWWSRAVNRDYVRVVLRGASGVFEALAYVDRDTGSRYLQGILD